VIPEIQLVQDEVEVVREVFSDALTFTAAFDVTTEAALPFGLKPHTRSVSWLVEQVVCQSIKSHSAEIGVSDVDYDLPDTELHDIEFSKDGTKYFVNVKSHQADRKANKNDISAVVKLYERYRDQPSYRLYYACVAIRFDSTHKNRRILFLETDMVVFSPQFLPLYINPTNDKIQAFYLHTPELRTRDQFLGELRTNSKTLKLR
jgi:hypothetical protein